ncbi:G-protein coupled receptor Mth2 [Amphibalanus amphitrite]|uniref:G-protein coupled receptor Mth2 n=1 Tax=Amphibalanus amphitrite TaxID=1232801 RepID=A0A6A4X5A4_AMPAM|nr:G-protein coupled receptor Mth2 [Amphibalanus amphitrite]
MTHQHHMWRAGLLFLVALAAAPLVVSGQSVPPRRPLADDLPEPRWRQQAARILRCCAEDEALVRSSDPAELPSCQPVGEELRWRPQLLNARAGSRGPPDSRLTVLQTGNLTCTEGSFWLDGGRPEQRFELLTTGELYRSEVDVLQPAQQFCAGRLIEPHNLTDAEGVAIDGAIVCNVSMHQLSSLVDETLLEPTCRRETCFRKCCPRGLYMDRYQRCLPLPANNTWRPSFYRSLTHPAGSGSYRTIWGNARCPPSEDGQYGRVFPLQPVFRDLDRFYLQTNGSLWVPGQQKMTNLPHFCVDQMLYSLNGSEQFHAFAILCFGGSPPAVAPRHYVMEALLIVSAALLLVTFAIYAAIPELRNVHGRCLMSHVAALFTAYVCRIASQTAFVYRSLPFCQAIAIIMYYSFLAVCFWLNTMSFDIWRTFSRVHAPTTGGSGTRRFIRYSVYSWLSPLALTAVTVLMQYAPERLVPTEIYLRPGFGEYRCWFPVPGRWELLAYLHGPLLVLMTANLALFLMTARCLLKSEHDTQLVRKKKTAVERLKIYVNLFIVMGITWVAEALSVNVGSEVLWYVSDAVNCLQGVIIFLLFTMRERSRRIILRHLDSWGVCRWCRGCRSPTSDGRAGALLSSSNKTRTTSVPTGTSGRASQLQELEPVMAAAAGAAAGDANTSAD